MKHQSAQQDKSKNLQLVLLECNIAMLKTINHMDQLLTDILDIWKDESRKTVNKK